VELLLHGSILSHLLERLKKLVFTLQVGHLNLGLHALLGKFEALLFTFQQFLVQLLYLSVFLVGLGLETLRLSEKLMEFVVQLLKDSLILDDSKVQVIDGLMLHWILDRDVLVQLI